MATHTRGIEMTEAALEEKSKLQRHFGRFDMLFFLICTLVGLDTIGSVASHGAQAFTWLIFLGVFFFVPYALVISELGSAFPDEGGPYMWTRLAFGRFVGAINTIVYWVANPVWVGGTLAILAMTTFSAFFTDISGNDVVK
jgi:glutamate:GABA antiporter